MMQQRNYRKHTIDKKITDTRNKKRKMSAVNITTENQYMVAETITVFINAQQYQNEAVSSSGNPNRNVATQEKIDKLRPQ